MGDPSRPSSAKSRLVAAMDRLDRLMAELDGAVARLDARTERPRAHGGIVGAPYGSGVSFRDPDNIALEFFAPPG